MRLLFKNFKVLPLAVLIMSVLIIVPGMTLAQATSTSATGGVGFDPYENFEVGSTGNELQQETGLGNAEPSIMAGRIINVALGILGLFTLLLFLYGGFIWMNARGNEEEVAKAKKILTGAVIGLVIILASYGISSYIFYEIQRTSDVNALNP